MVNIFGISKKGAAIIDISHLQGIFITESRASQVKSFKFSHHYSRDNACNLLV